MDMAAKKKKRAAGGGCEQGGSQVNPVHYRIHGSACIEVIRNSLTPEEFRGFLKGNVIKYNYRAGHKGDAAVDYNKALWYQRELHAAAVSEKWTTEHADAKPENQA